MTTVERIEIFDKNGSLMNFAQIKEETAQALGVLLDLGLVSYEIGRKGVLTVHLDRKIISRSSAVAVTYEFEKDR